MAKPVQIVTGTRIDYLDSYGIKRDGLLFFFLALYREKKKSYNKRTELYVTVYLLHFGTRATRVWEEWSWDQIQNVRRGTESPWIAGLGSPRPPPPQEHMLLN